MKVMLTLEVEQVGQADENLVRQSVADRVEFLMVGDETYDAELMTHWTINKVQLVDAEALL